MFRIETPRLRIRLFSSDDVAPLARIIGDPEVMKYSLHGVYDENATRQFMAWCHNCQAAHGYSPWAVEDKVSGELMGFSGIYPETVNGQEEAGLGYRFARHRWNRGFATEANLAVLEYVFTQRQVPTVIALIEPENAASVRVAEKTGFRDFVETRFENRNVRAYRISRDRWLETRQALE
ncbi:GNAT family N-acetyltransferase [Halomonas binhaiensis]|uniref:GNAT family N-acetyltransferase n=1 Tax=Halomonas binhaiensis TaxID=2562282 RepID=A0A5C1NF12_9GAMM|nr:GNAT family N-acetyltransferase [Halomonas binhaiensis]QEM81806.1 GNAT family N-acetyltransferase [Halomonas binhaiensis]